MRMVISGKAADGDRIRRVPYCVFGTGTFLSVFLVSFPVSFFELYDCLSLGLLAARPEAHPPSG